MKTSTAALVLAVLALSLTSLAQALPLNTDDLGLLGQGVDGSAVDEADVPRGEAGAGLTAEELEDLSALGLDEATRGELRRAARTGFDVYEDTVDFDNRGGVVCREGVCMGMSFISRDIWKRVEFVDDGSEPGNLGRALVSSLALPVGGRRKVAGAANLRDLAEKDPGLQDQLMKIFEGAMVRDLHPATIRAFVGGLTHVERGDRTAAWVEDRAARGEPSLMLYTGGTPHVTLAYKVLSFENLRLVYIYDCNRVYRRSENTHRTTFLITRRSDRELRLFPESYAGMYGDKMDHVTCAESLTKQLARIVGRALFVTAPRAVVDGVQTGLQVGGSVVGGVGRALVGGVAHLLGH